MEADTQSVPARNKKIHETTDGQTCCKEEEKETEEKKRGAGESNVDIPPELS